MQACLDEDVPNRKEAGQQLWKNNRGHVREGTLVDPGEQAAHVAKGVAAAMRAYYSELSAEAVPTSHFFHLYCIDTIFDDKGGPYITEINIAPNIDDKRAGGSVIKMLYGAFDILFEVTRRKLNGSLHADELATPRIHGWEELQ